MADELLDVINDNNETIDKQMKSTVHSQGLPHRVSAVLVQKEDGSYLIPTASDLKVEAGGLFHSGAGHIPAGESYVQAAVRELWEETGLKASEDEMELVGSYWLEKEYPTRKEKERFEVFRIKYRPEMGNIVLNEEQINEQWFTEDQLREIYSNSPEKLSAPLKLTCEIIFKFQ